MSESKQHKMLKHKAKEQFLDRGYSLLSFDQEVVDGYRPDMILENEEEVLFVEIVATSDHELDDNLTYHGKPIRFVKYYTLDSWVRANLGTGTRKSPEEIGRAIMEVLDNESKTIQQISEEIGSSWSTTLKYLKLMEWVQKCPKISKVRIAKHIEIWKREWGRIPS